METFSHESILKIGSDKDNLIKPDEPDLYYDLDSELIIEELDIFSSVYKRPFNQKLTFLTC